MANVEERIQKKSLTFGFDFIGFRKRSSKLFSKVDTSSIRVVPEGDWREGKF